MSKNTVEDYDLGLNGNSFQVGPLSLRMYDVMTERSTALDQVSDPEQIRQILRALKLYALDFTAKEAVRAALKQNGLELALQDDEQDMNMWGEVDSIQLLDMETSNDPVGPMYDDWEDAVDDWTPGQAFNFVVRQVPAKMRELSLEELLQALDPDGSLRKEAKEAGVKYMTPDSDECQSLAEMASENVRRAEETPQEAVAEDEVFAGTSARGYQVIAASDLENLWENSDESSSSFLQSQTVLHVMDALVSHGCLIVDISSGGRDTVATEQLAKMWKTCEAFFTTAVDSSEDKSLPPLVTAEGTSSKYAKIGYASYDNGNMQFLETRVSRETGEFLPSEVQSLLGTEGCDSMKNSFDVLAAVGKNVIRVAVTASTLEATKSISGLIPKDFDAILAGKRVAEELVDDGRPFEAEKDDSVCMSPHRICRYSNNKGAQGSQNNKRDESTKQTTKEIFGAHTDSTFVTIVPVAEVSGLEVYDEAAEKWFRPEVVARRQYNENYAAADSSDRLPWYSRYCVIMPGEFLQLLSRQEILASVHRVVATRHGQSRYSAPLLLRGRSSALLDASRYFGEATTPLLKECDGRTMDDIHSAMQPNSFQ